MTAAELREDSIAVGAQQTFYRKPCKIVGQHIPPGVMHFQRGGDMFLSRCKVGLRRIFRSRFL